jgi:hypothetical protein
MNTVNLAAIVLIVAGILGLSYSGFTYTKEKHSVDLGPIHMTMSEREGVNVPMWAGIGAILVGGGLLVMGRRSG